jgi:hypothetical protein
VGITDYLDVIFLRFKGCAGVTTYVNYLKLLGSLQKDHVKASHILHCFVFLGVKKLDIFNRLSIGFFESLYDPLVEVVNVDLLFNFVES